MVPDCKVPDYEKVPDPKVPDCNAPDERCQQDAMSRKVPDCKMPVDARMKGARFATVSRRHTRCQIGAK